MLTNMGKKVFSCKFVTASYLPLRTVTITETKHDTRTRKYIKTDVQKRIKINKSLDDEYLLLLKTVLILQ